MTSRLRREDLVRMALRSSLLQATWNYERQQGLGWAWALQPALDRLYLGSLERCERLAEHTAFFNTQPTMASLALGAVAGLEERRAAGEGPDTDGMRRVKSALGSALAALGDRLFWFSLRPFAACVGVLLTLSGSRWGGLGLWLCYNLVHQSLRLWGVGWGYREGPEVLGAALRRRLERLTRLVGQLGSALVGVTIAVLLAPGGDSRPVSFQALLAIGLAAGLVVAHRGRPSPTAWALGAGFVSLAAVWFG